MNKIFIFLIAGLLFSCTQENTQLEQQPEVAFKQLSETSNKYQDEIRSLNNLTDYFSRTNEFSKGELVALTITYKDNPEMLLKILETKFWFDTEKFELYVINVLDDFKDLAKDDINNIITIMVNNRLEYENYQNSNSEFPCLSAYESSIAIATSAFLACAALSAETAVGPIVCGVFYGGAISAAEQSFENCIENTYN